MSNFEEFLESIKYAPVDVLKYFGLIKELSLMERGQEEQLDKVQKQIEPMMNIDPCKEKDILLSDYKGKVERAQCQLLALHRERINCAEVLRNMLQRYIEQLDIEGEKFLDELKMMPKEQDVDMGRKSVREFTKPEPAFSRTGTLGKKKPTNRQLEPEPEQEDITNKPYCFCQKPSEGTMVACDNSQCKREWFHLACVGLVDVPSASQKWYCSECEPRFR